jgi:PAS domain S-box-containing protein
VAPAIEAQHIIAGSHDAILVLDPDSEIILDANEMASTLYGVPLPELIGRSFHEFTIDAAKGRQDAAKTLNSSSYHEFETRQRRADGTEIHVDVHARTIEFQGQKAILSLNRDITERHLLLRRLLTVAGEWQLTVDAIDAAIVLLDEERRIVRVNRAARDLAGAVEFEELIGTPISRLAPEEPWKRGLELATWALSERTSITGSVMTESQTWDIAVGVLSQVGSLHAVLVLRDVTNLVRLEASLRRIEQLAELGELVGGVAHEVRNPLFIISASFEALEMRLEIRDQIARQHLTNLRREIDRLTTLMNDLLEYAKPTQLVISIGELDAVVAEAISDSKEAAARAGVTLLNAFPAGLGSILLDARRIGGALKNLIDNALAHSTAGQTVTIRGAVSAGSGNDWLACSVEDEGPGFASADLPKIFEPFFTKRKGGTGLGLSIVRRTVELHGGRIRAENRAERGGRVTLEFPRVPSET